MKKLLVIALSLGLVGCATTPITNEQAKEIPANQLLDSSLTVPKQGAGKVVIKRDGGARGSLCDIKVFADGKPVALLNAAEKVTIYLDVGEHVFSNKGLGLCTSDLKSVSGKSSLDKTYSYRVGLGSTGEYAIYPDAS